MSDIKIDDKEYKIADFNDEQKIIVQAIQENINQKNEHLKKAKNSEIIENYYKQKLIDSLKVKSEKE